MVGNAADAALAVALYNGDTDEAYPYFLGAGCSRNAYLINGVVYKINRNGFLDNEEEFHTANDLRAVMASFDVFVPEVTLFGEVLAMEYINGEPTGECLSVFPECDCPDVCIPDALLANLTFFGWRDPAYGNAMWLNEKLWLIDLA